MNENYTIPLPPNTHPLYSFSSTLSPAIYKHFLIAVNFFRYKRVPIMLLIMSFLGAFWIGMDNQILFWPFYALATLIFFALIVGVLLLRIERRKRKTVKEDLSGRFTSEMTLHFCPEKIVFVTKEFNGVSEIPYDQVYQLMESRRLYMIYVTSNQAVLLPKAVIASEQAQAFNQFIRGHITRQYKDISKFI